MDRMSGSFVPQARAIANGPHAPTQSPHSTEQPMSKFLTSAGWKVILKDSAKDKKTTITDTGLLKALEKYESRKAGDFKARLDDLKNVFKLGLSLSATCKKLPYQPAVD